MFSSKKNGNGSSMEAFSINSIGLGSTISGDIVAKNDFRIDGALNGNLTCDARIIIGESGNIEGNIICASAVIQGKLTGTLKVSDTLEVNSKAIINGEVSTGRLIIENGAIFYVKCRWVWQQEANRIFLIQKAILKS
ncbi:MAG: polymer-forming cytoskeletal protein [Saprospiraceae bacterium]|nr:polymer-forming cytoskeletal protein [Candidatus Brachybacter algidus]MBL0119045.1 polymer-forming cytoskeletal protein [Candidatus Brachybacter algidus]